MQITDVLSKNCKCGVVPLGLNVYAALTVCALENVFTVDPLTFSHPVVGECHCPYFTQIFDTPFGSPVRLSCIVPSYKPGLFDEFILIWYWRVESSAGWVTAVLFS